MPKPPALVRKGHVEPGKPLHLDPTKMGELTTTTPRTPASPVLRDGNVVIEGELDPPNANEPIAVELVHAGVSRLLHTKTDDKGRYMVRDRVTKRGLWRVQSFFAGDDVLAAADSNLCSFQLRGR